jgi:RNA polymerase sigma-70 factor, ECF subfamily
MAVDFTVFYDLHFEAVYRFVSFRVSHNRAVAEDLTSEIFISALAAFEDYDPNQGAKAWIMTIARHKLINYWRDKKDQVDIDDVAFCLEGTNGQVQVEIADDIRNLQAALQQLTANERILIEKKYLLGYRYHELSQELAKPAASLRVDTYRAMKKLTALMRRHV